MKKQCFNNGWMFKKQGSPSAEGIDLPHDAMILEKRDPQSPGGSAVAFFPPGVYEYAKVFHAPTEWEGQRVAFQFEGVYRNSTVTINGKATGGHPYGYIPFVVETEGLLQYGQDNTIRVTADNSQMPNSRWYTGAGIYRPVWLWTGAASHIDIEGVRISTVSYRPARIRVETAVIGGGEVAVAVTYKGQTVAKGTGASLELEIPNARLWSETSPELYQCCVTLTENGHIVDETTESFGIRLVEWNPKGLFINGVNTLLRGGCIHHDNGILGARCYAKSEARRVSMLKAAGFNALRISHNPASAALLEACDRLGMYVIDETWDMWYNHKSKYDYAADFMENYRHDIKTMVTRDFTHPSVIMYSIGNEVTEPIEEKGLALIREMVTYIHSLDRGRAVTCGLNLWLLNKTSKGKGVYQSEGGNDKRNKDMNSTVFNMVASTVGTSINNGAKSRDADAVTSPCIDALDIAGYNYSSGRYPLEGKAHPNRVIYGAETYPQDIAKNWAMVKKYPYLVGDFMWTAWDYLGESGLAHGPTRMTGAGLTSPTPGCWPIPVCLIFWAIRAANCFWHRLCGAF